MTEAASQPHCTFCRIIAGQDPAAIVHRDDHTLAFMDINPVSRGHTLVIPIEHYPDLYTMPDELSRHLMTTASRLVRALKSAFGAAGVNLWMANERPAGQVVFHAHMHVIPRYRDDGIRLYAPGRDHASRPALEQAAAEICAALESLRNE